MSEDKKEPKVVIIKTKDENVERVKRRTTLIVLIVLVFIFDVILAIIFIPRFIERNKNKTSESSLVISDSTESNINLYHYN